MHLQLVFSRGGVPLIRGSDAVVPAILRPRRPRVGVIIASKERETPHEHAFGAIIPSALIEGRDLKPLIDGMKARFAKYRPTMKLDEKTWDLTLCVLMPSQMGGRQLRRECSRLKQLLDTTGFLASPIVSHLKRKH